MSDTDSAKPAKTPHLSGKQKRHLRGLGHHLDAVVQIGKHGLTDATTRAVDQAIMTHELVKVRCGSECPHAPKEVGEALAEKLGAAFVQKLGRTLLLYRRHPKKPKINLPASA